MYLKNMSVMLEKHAEQERKNATEAARQRAIQVGDRVTFRPFLQFDENGCREFTELKEGVVTFIPKHRRFFNVTRTIKQAGLFGCGEEVELTESVRPEGVRKI